MIKYINNEDLEVKTWSGGTTTELYISPESSNYKQLTFDFRISTASVDVDHSTFTSLPGINRLIMSLTDSLELTHKDQYSVLLKPFEVEAFKGDWQTQSKGKVVDFNVMYKETHNASMSVLSLDNSSEIKCTQTTILYAFEEAVNVTIFDHSYTLKKGDLLVTDETALITVSGKKSKVIVCEIEKSKYK